MSSVKLEKWQKICIGLCGFGLLCSLLLLVPFVQNWILDFAEAVVVHRPLTRSVWCERFTKQGMKTCRIFLICNGIVFFWKWKTISEIIGDKKLDWITIITLTGVCGLLGVMNLNLGHNWGGDFSEYIADARNLVTGVYNPNQPKIGYPYGTAIILAPFYRIFGLDIFALKIPMLVLYIGTVFFIGLLFKKRFSKLKLFLITGVFAFNTFMISFLNNVLSDIPFMFFSTAAVYCIDGIYDEKKSQKKQIVFSIFAGICVSYSKMCRDEGLVLMLAFLCTEILLILKLVFNKNAFIKKMSSSLNSKGILPHIIFYLSVVVTFFILHFFVEVITDRTDIASYILVSIRSIIDMAIYNFLILKDFFFSKTFLWVLCVPLLAVGIAEGFFYEIFIIIYMIGIICLHCLWTAKQGLRFLFPILPFIAMLVFYGFDNLDKVLKGKYYLVVKKCCAWFAMLFCIFSFKSSFLNGISNLINHREWNYEAFSSYAKELYAYITENTNEDDKILFRKARVLFLNTFRGTETLTNIPDVRISLNGDLFEAQLNANNYLLISSDFYERISDYYITNDKELVLVFKNDKFELYKINDR